MSAAARRKRRNQLLTWAEKDPDLVLDQGLYRDPDFCKGFFDRCENRALTDAPEALDLALRAVHFAETSGDPHLINLSFGVLAHAHIARSDLFWAGKVLAGYRRQALGCCPRCRSDHLRRWGDFFVELRKPEESLAALRRSIQEGGRELTRDDRGRIFFLRGIAHHHLGQRGKALADGRRTLRDLSLESPRGIFHDTVACLAIYTAAGGLRDDAVALEALSDFRRRVKGVDGWQQALLHLRWVKGQLYARLGDFKSANRYLGRAQRRLLVVGLPREAVAATLDFLQLRCRHAEPRTGVQRSCRRAIDRLLESRSDLSEEHVEGLGEMKKILELNPEKAFDELGKLRGSFTAPVPGLLGCLRARVE